MRRGTFRFVIFVGPYAFKFPRASDLFVGLRCNRWEREMWRVWQPKLGWETLCPVLFADPLGFVVVMPRAEPVTYIDWLLRPDYYPETSGEPKAADWGRVGGCVVTFDYGLPDKQGVAEYRKRYKARKGAAQVVRPSRAELRHDAEALRRWAESNRFVRHLWIYGSRARGEARPDSDLDVAIEVDPERNDEDAYTFFFHENEGWRSKLQQLLTYKLHLKWCDKERNRPIWEAVINDGILVYARDD